MLKSNGSNSSSSSPVYNIYFLKGVGMQWCVDAATVSQTKSDTMCAADWIYLDTSDALRAVLILERERERERGERREGK